MVYMLDTDVCSYLMKRAPGHLLAKLQAAVENGDTICLSVITYSELRLGAARSNAAPKYHGLIDELSDRLDFIADWTTKEADQFAELQASLLADGSPIGQNDTMIAAHAMTLEATLITNNQKHFSRVAGLAIVNWVDS